MLQLTIKETELFDEATNRRVRTKGATIKLEHSLVSLSKWESKWKVPFLATDNKTREMMIDYARCMSITQNVDPNVYNGLTGEHMKMLEDYINDKMSATTFKNLGGGKKNTSVTTAEIIYYWMVSLQIPFEPCEKWHLNRLLTLIRVCDEKGSPKKKMSRREALQQQKSLNAARRAKYHTKG